MGGGRKQSGGLFFADAATSVSEAIGAGSDGTKFPSLRQIDKRPRSFLAVGVISCKAA